MIKNADINAKLNNYINIKQRDAHKSDKDAWNALKHGDYETACEIFR